MNGFNRASARRHLIKNLLLAQTKNTKKSADAVPDKGQALNYTDLM